MKSSLISRAAIVLCILLPALAFQFTETSRQKNARLVIGNESLPAYVDDWIGTTVELTDDEKEILHTPSASQRVYENDKTGDTVQILMVQVNNTQNAHDPRFCMTGAGYGIKDQHVIDVSWANSGGSSSKVTSVLFEKEDSQVRMFYWLQTPDDVVADMSSGFKMEGVKRALRGQSTRGIAVRLICLGNRKTKGVTPDEVGIALWKKIDGKLNILSLAKGI